MYTLIDKLAKDHILTPKEFLELLNELDINNNLVIYLNKKALEAKSQYYSNKIYMRGLLEFTNYCKNNCMYCGIRRSNNNVERYRLTEEAILDCCSEGYSLGYRTFVLQGGEDPYFDDEKVVSIVSNIKSNFPDCAITLSIGEKNYASYEKYYKAGATRYLLRHETFSEILYNKLHPNMSFKNRIQCLWNLKEIGYQIGAGFMVGLPEQTNEDFVKDLLFLHELQPHMVGIGPFMPQKYTPLAHAQAGTANKTIILLSLIRLILPKVLLPATTALGSIDSKGREMGLKAGANVVMPNLSPTDVRDKYLLYDGKICTGDEAAHCRSCIEQRIKSVGFEVDMSRGDHYDMKNF